MYLKSTILFYKMFYKQHVGNSDLLHKIYKDNYKMIHFFIAICNLLIYRVYVFEIKKRFYKKRVKNSVSL